MSWVNVNDRMPPAWGKAYDAEGRFVDATSYLVTDGAEVWIEERWIKGFANDDGRDLFDEPPVTHWMPIPPPPC